MYRDPATATVESIHVVQAFTDRVTRRLGDWIRKVLFFGSQARGKAGAGSDYDLLVVVRRKDPDLVDQLYDEVLDCLFRDGVEVSLKIYTQESFEDGLRLRNPFLCSVTETGVELWTAREKS